MSKNFIILFLFVTLGACNIFYWVHPFSPEGLSTEQKFEQAQKLLLNGSYDEAAQYYESILDEQPKNSEAILGYSQAKLSSVTENIVTLLPQLSSLQQETSSIDTATLIDQVNSMLSTAEQVKEKLQLLVNGQADGTVPETDPVANALYAITDLVTIATVADSDADNKIEPEEVENIGELFSDTGTLAEEVDSRLQQVKKHADIALNNGIEDVSPDLATLLSGISGSE